MKKSIHLLILNLVLSAAVFGADLYMVSVQSRQDSELLKDLNVEPILRAGNEYIILADRTEYDFILSRNMDIQFLAGNVNKHELALDNRRDRENVNRYRLIYEKDNVRLFLIDPIDLQPTEDIPDLMPIYNRNIQITYVEPSPVQVRTPRIDIDLEYLVSLVVQDSVESYVERLQAFYCRVTGTDSAYAARDWIKSKFESFGYDSVYTDSFTADIQIENTSCFNVVAVKEGSLYPEIHIIVGGHYDGVLNSPAADDNGSGTAGVLEIARVLAAIETHVSIIFVAFDAEEWGLSGAWHYANNAFLNNDQLFVMFNLDMIGHLPNTDEAELFHGANTRFAQTWINLADSLTGITGYLSGSSGGSDHFPFDQNGFDVAFIAEYIFSDNWHTPQDSTVYMNFDYATRMIEATLATVYVEANGEDFDNDGILNENDNCIIIANSSQDDFDSDGLGDICDNCPALANSDQEDADNDGMGNICDDCPYDSYNDIDGDGICGDIDNCPNNNNPGQDDVDQDGVGDACECNAAEFVFTGDRRNLLGWAIAGAGDVNNDGTDDIIVGAQGYYSYKGRIYIYSGEDGSTLDYASGGTSGDRFGFAVNGIGDVDQDGYDDYIVGAPAAGGGYGQAYVYSGQYGIKIHTFTGNSIGDFYGTSVAGIGDINGDSIPDIAVGAIHYLSFGPGEAFIYSGQDFSQIYSYSGEHNGDRFGICISEVGDVNNDNVPDFAISATRNSLVIQNAGQAYVYSGQDGGLLHTFIGQEEGDALGAGLAPVGDINGDNHDDILISAVQTLGTSVQNGKAMIYSGRDGAILRTHTGEAAGDIFGQAVAGLGDINNDGYDDYVIGAPDKYELKNPTGLGRVYAYSGQDGALLNVYARVLLWDMYGWDVANVGDINNDGMNDLAVSAYGNDEGGIDAGQVYVYLMGDTDNDGFMVGCDNCPYDYNSGQNDDDIDEVGDACDNCPNHFNPGQEDGDDNGVGDVCDYVCGDANNNGDVNILDVTFLISYLYKDGQAPDYMDACDVNDSGTVNILDVTYLISYLYKDGPELNCPQNK